MRTIGEKIREIRTSHVLTQENFAKSLGISRPHLSKIESNKENASDSVIKLICKLYNVSYEWLTTDTEDISISIDMDALSKGMSLNQTLRLGSITRIAADILENKKVYTTSRSYFLKNIEAIFESLKKFYGRSDIQKCDDQDIEIVCAYIEKRMNAALEAFKNENLDKKMDE